jgi:ATP-binding cassette subfamily G (WHITE) protein 2 (SNQ2)
VNPQTLTLFQFDRILALQRGGKVFYNGPVGTSGDSVFKYFEQRGCRANQGTNVADFIIDIGAGSILPKPSRSVDWSEDWINSAEAQDVLRVIEGIAATSPLTCDDALQEYSSSTANQIKLLTVRNLKQFWRLPEYQYARLYACCIHALFNGLTYLQLGNSEHDMQSMAYSLFLILMLVPEFINGISMRFIANRNIWLEKELPGRTYGIVAFASSQIIAELPFTFAGAIIFFVIFYFMVGLPLGIQAGYTFLMTLFFHLFATSWGQWIAALR